jgi:pimeloyl-ACP methyl ester carboxylesterase
MTIPKLSMESVMSLETFFQNFEVGIKSTPLETLKSKYCDADSKFITINGLNVHYKDQGTGPVLVLLHGVVASLHTWDGWCDHLKDHYRIIRLDMPGWGITGPSMEEKYLGEHIVEFLDDFLEALEIDHMYLAGNSLGGYYAWNYAVHRPEKVDKLILLDPIAYNQSLPYEFKLAKLPGAAFLLNNVMIPRFLIKSSLERLYGRKERITARTYDLYWEHIMRPGNRRTLSKVFNMIAELSKSDTIYLDVKKIKQPVLLVWGKQDIWSRWKETLDAWKQDLPHAELLLYDQCGHMPMEEIPVESARDAHAFLMKGAEQRKPARALKLVHRKSRR